MTSSGTEAAMTAVRLARAATGRERILKFAGAYHGHADGLLAQAGSGWPRRRCPRARACRRARLRARSSCRGTTPTRSSPPPSATSSPRSSPSRCPPTWASCLPRDGFLALLRERADANGALLVLDEVISGFRVARGGAQELMGVRGDLVDPRQGHRRRPARGGGGRPRGADADARPRRRGLPGGHAVGQPARGGRRAGDARAARRARLPAPRRASPTASPTACARRPAEAGGYPVQVVSDAGAGDGLLQRAPGGAVSRTRRRATWTPTRRGAGSCSRAASTHPRRSSRPGFPSLAHTPSRSSARWRPPPRPSRCLPACVRPSGCAPSRGEPVAGR